MWNYILGPFLALLPMRWRRALFPEAPVAWAHAAVISGLLEWAACLSGLIEWYLVLMSRYTERLLNVAATAHAVRPIDDHDVGFMALLLFVLHPVTWALFFGFLEGPLRTITALAAEESPGMLPLVLADRLWLWIFRRAKRVPLVADEVTRTNAPAGATLRVASCREKPAWRPPLTIQFNGEFFQVTGESRASATPARPFVYTLKKLDAREIVRGLEHFDPREVLRSESEPGAFVTVLRVLRDRLRVARLPLVDDEVRAGDSGSRELLEVRSCRPKPDWHISRLVRFEDGYYRVESCSRAEGSRPFLFSLRRLPAGVPGRSVLIYSPNEPFARARAR